MNTLQTLAASALLGTERRAPDWPQIEGGMGDMIRALTDQPPEEKLLRVAGIIGTCHLAGWTPEVVASIPAEACAEETLSPLQNEPLEQALANALAEGPLRLQAEAFAALSRARLAMPRRLLPKALDAGKRSTALRPFLLPVLGQRGAWLAKQNTDWSYAIGSGGEALDQDAWEHGGLDQRKLFLQALRRQDAPRARELVAAAFTTEGARERAALLDEMKTGLSLDDQDMLESTLRDKSKEVRETAARLLGSLTGSHFMERMAARLEPCLTREKKFLRGEVVKLEPPAAFSAEWKADLIEEAKPQHHSLGERAWWLMQILRHTPLGWWEQRTGMKPAELLAWAAKSDWKDALLQGWATAQSLQRRADWAAAFLDSGFLEGVNISVFDQLEVLPAAEREKHWLELLKNGVAAKSAVSTMLDRCLKLLPLDAQMQSADLARRIMRLLKDHLHGGGAQHDWQLRASLIEFACVLPAAIFQEAQQGWDLARPELQPFAEAIARLGTVLDARQLIHKLQP